MLTDELTTIVHTYKPHIVAITETWLHDQINDAEIAINDYHIFVKIEKAEEFVIASFVETFQLRLDARWPSLFPEVPF